MQTKIPCDLERAEASVYSQNGEDGVLARIFDLIGVTNKYFVEFGVGADGMERNTRLLEEQHGWRGLLMDCGARESHARIRRENVTAENINAHFAKYEVPEEFDLLSIDIDGNDYWVWQAIDARYRPRVVIVEYNASIRPTDSRVAAYDPNFRWEGTDYFGASLLALARLSRRKGYEPVYCESRGVNAFFMRQDVLPYNERSIEAIYRQPDYLGSWFLGLARWHWPRGVGHRKDARRKMIEVQ